MIQIRLVIDKFALNRLVGKLQAAPNKVRKKGTLRIVKASSRVYLKGAKPAAPVRYGALRQALKVMKVKRAKADAYVKVRPDPKTVRHVKTNDETKAGSRRSRLLKLADSRKIVAEENAKKLQRRQRRPRIRPNAYAHLTEGRNTTSTNWLRRNSRAKESQAVQAATNEAQAVLREAL